MTDIVPGAAARPVVDAVRPAVDAVSEIKNNAQRLGLTWTLRPATMVSASTGTADGDTETVGVTSLIGVLSPNVRVMLMQVPGGGNYAVGFLQYAGPGLGVIGEVSQTTASANVTAETVIMTTPSIVFLPGRVYEINVEGGVFGSVAGNLAYIRVRENGLIGTTLVDFFRVRTEAANVVDLNLSAKIGNTGTSPNSVALALTLQLSGGSGTVALFGNADTTLRLTVTDVGPASALSNLKSL